MVKFPESSAQVLGSQMLSYETRTKVGVKTVCIHVARFIYIYVCVCGITIFTKKSWVDGKMWSDCHPTKYPRC
jgi:hypothetical protein